MIKLFFYAVVLLFTRSCAQDRFRDEVKAFIPGTYTRVSSHEFGKEYDTLVITRHNNSYSIQRKWRYERIRDGRGLEAEYKRKTIPAVYNAKHKFLQDSGGDVFSFDVKEALLFNGPVRYKKAAP